MAGGARQADGYRPDLDTSTFVDNSCKRTERENEMQAYAVLMLLPMLVYGLAQTFRDVRRRSWGFSAWGGATIFYLGWIIEALTRAPSY